MCIYIYIYIYIYILYLFERIPLDTVVQGGLSWGVVQAGAGLSGGVVRQPVLKANMLLSRGASSTILHFNGAFAWDFLAGAL